MTTRTHTELNKMKRRQWTRDVERERRIMEFGAEPLTIVKDTPLNEEVRNKRIALFCKLDYLSRNNITEQQLRLRQKESRRLWASKSRKRGDERNTRQFVTGVLGTMKRKCRKEGIPFDLEVDDVVIPSHCPVLGIEMKWCNKITEQTPSFDRFDPDGGYVKGNVNVISFKANRLKSNATIDELKAIIDWMEKTSPSASTAP